MQLRLKMHSMKQEIVGTVLFAGFSIMMQISVDVAGMFQII